MFSALVLLALLGAPLPASPAAGAASSPASALELRPETPTSGPLAPGESRVFLVSLAEGQFVHLEVSQQGLPLTVRLASPAGVAVAEIGNPTSDDDPLPVSAVASSSGGYRLTLALAAAASSGGRYEVRLAQPRPAVPEDEKRIAAEVAFAEGQRLRAEGSAAALREALSRNERAARLAREGGDPRREAFARREAGDLLYLLADLNGAHEQMQIALERWRSIGDEKQIAQTLNDLGVVAMDLGQPQPAIEHYGEALPLARALGNRQLEAILLHDLGFVFLWLHDSERALDYFRRALALKRVRGDRRSMAVTLNTMGQAYSKLEKYETALRYYGEALALRRAIGDRRGQGVTLTNIGWVYEDLGRKRDALDFYRRALELSRAVGNRFQEAITLDSQGETLAALGRPDEALECYRKALRISREVGDPPDQAIALADEARVLRNLGRLEEARDAAEEALRLTESTRSAVVGPERRASLASSTRGRYDILVDILARLQQRRPGEGFDAAALVVSERARARGLLELLAETRLDLRQGVDPALLERERVLVDAMEKKSKQEAQLLAGIAGAGSVEAVRHELGSLAAQLEEMRNLIRARSPHYAALALPQPLDLAGIRREVVDSGTLLLEYFLGDEQSYLWAVGLDSIVLYRLPPRRTVEAAVRRLYRTWSSSSPDPKEGHEAEALGQMLLGPVAGTLGDKRLLIVADGALQYLPFAALPVPGRGTSLVIDRHEVVVLPSASTLPILRREASARLPAPLVAAVFADPVFDASDPRVARGARPSPRATTAALERAARESGLRAFERLRATRREAEVILALIPAQERLAALDFKASRPSVIAADLARYRILHFATHGLLDSGHPDLSGLVLSLVDEAGRPQNGFLRAHEIYGLKLGADLVVLSACQTALGKEVWGEGLLGLTRGFMYAGVPRVVASLWKVSDRATAELMSRFYRAMLVDRLPPAAALGEAQRSLKRDRRYGSPYFWAPFTLQGEWR